MLSEFISLKRILINIHTASIEEAVLICGELLVKDGCASPEYPAAMVETVRQLGDSIVMAPQTALPHAALFKRGSGSGCLGSPFGPAIGFGRSQRSCRAFVGLLRI